jgi:hypothetical protein
MGGFLVNNIPQHNLSLGLLLEWRFRKLRSLHSKYHLLGLSRGLAVFMGMGGNVW